VRALYSEESLREPIRLALERKVDLLAALEVLGDAKEVVARYGDDVDERLHPRPSARPGQFTLVLTAVRPKNEGLPPACDMHQQLTDRPRGFFYIGIKLLIGQSSARFK
jgi:hypothetical protein